MILHAYRFLCMYITVDLHLSEIYHIHHSLGLKKLLKIITSVCHACMTYTHACAHTHTHWSLEIIMMVQISGDLHHRFVASFQVRFVLGVRTVCCTVLGAYVSCQLLISFLLAHNSISCHFAYFGDSKPWCLSTNRLTMVTQLQFCLDLTHRLENRYHTSLSLSRDVKPCLSTS